MTSRSILALAALVFIGLIPVQAGPIQYTLSATASGTLGATPFTNALVTLTLTGNTANIIPGPGQFSDTVLEAGTAIVNVAGVGSALLTGQIVINDTLADNALGQPAIVIGQVDPGGQSATGILGQFGSSFLTYNLNGPLGPIGGTGGAFSGSHVTPHFSTSVGDLTWAIGQPSTPSTFTATLLNSQTIQGGAATAPVFLVGSNLGQVTGNIGGGFAHDFYSFNWGGGLFSATASIAGAQLGDIYTFSEGAVGTCAGGGSATLNNNDSFTGTISGNLAPGTYCIGLLTVSQSDPTGVLTFNTAINTTPEPASFVLAICGILAFVIIRYRRSVA